ncbi:unnamed protein product [marine sediment metagenome]|uniref:Uncharacterized protein n=1 Tax=marine sediment metagenome TaxID=412755 RepID=X0UIE9_9ZZZZ
MSRVREEPSGEKALDDDKPGRRKRVPFAGVVRKLHVAYKAPGYYYYWQKDTGDNIQRMRQAGYELVDAKTARMEVPEMLTNSDVSARTDLDGALRVHGGVGEGGRDYGMVLMRIPNALHEEDMAALAGKADEIDSAISRQAFQGGKETGLISDSTVYGDISITTKSEE